MSVSVWGGLTITESIHKTEEEAIRAGTRSDDAFLESSPLHPDENARCTRSCAKTRLTGLPHMSGTPTIFLLEGMEN